MGIKIENFQSSSPSFCYPKIVWNHNQEPDMLRSGDLKRYEVFKATQPNTSIVPTSYILLSTVDIHDTMIPSFVDLSVKKYDCTSTISVNDTIFPVRYYVIAVDSYNDKSVPSDFAQTFGVKQGISDPNGPDNFASSNSDLPKEYRLNQNYPNPFNPSTNIQFDLPEDNFVTIKIYNILGKEVIKLVNEYKQAGRYSVSFEGSMLSSGVYFYKFAANGNVIDTKRLVILK